MTNQISTQLILGTLAGLIVYAIIGSLGLYLLQTCWADYAVHSQDKSYTFTMFVSRLGVGLLAAITAGVAATTAAKGNGKSAWLAGIIIFCVAAYVHLLTVTWSQYPIWYHVSYLLPIIPVVGFSPYIFKGGNSVKKSL